MTGTPLPRLRLGQDFEQTDLFVSGTDGYHTYRIPALVVTTKGAILAFCEGRRHSQSDTGEIDMVLKRSQDGGKTWSPMQVIWHDGENTCDNPCPVVDSQTGTISLLMTHNFGHDNHRTIVERTGKGTRTAWLSKSADDGVTWTKPIEITETVKKDNWTWYATGPGAGIQLESGRLVIPCDHNEAETMKRCSHVIYSDDHGETWKLGGSTSSGKLNECEVVELADATLLLNMRNYDRNHKCRAIAASKDQGLTWSEISFDDALIEPICQASIRRFTSTTDSNRSRILFSNPAHADKRVNMTVRLSYDECRTWPVAKSLHRGPSAYSSLAVFPDRKIACFYECGEEHCYEKIALARFNVEWLTDGEDSLQPK